jgi:hypothetical protein
MSVRSHFRHRLRICYGIQRTIQPRVSRWTVGQPQLPRVLCHGFCSVWSRASFRPFESGFSEHSAPKSQAPSRRTGSAAPDRSAWSYRRDRQHLDVAWLSRGHRALRSLGRTDQSAMTINPAGPQARPDRPAGAQEPAQSPAVAAQPSPADLLQQPQDRQAADVARAMAELRQRAAELSEELQASSPHPAPKPKWVSSTRPPRPRSPLNPNPRLSQVHRHPLPHPAKAGAFPDSVQQGIDRRCHQAGTVRPPRPGRCSPGSGNPDSRSPLDRHNSHDAQAAEPHRADYLPARRNGEKR